MKKERLTIEDRILIEELLRQNYKLKDIARVIEVYPSTISREVKFRRIGNLNLKICDKTNRFPFVCYNCSKKVHSNKRKYYYNYKQAQKDYENKLKYSRIGIDMSIDEVEYWNDYFKDKIKDKNQPILHIFKNIENEFPKSIQSFYKYVHKGYFSSIHDEMLARSFSYKPRNKKETIKTITKDNIIKKGRRMTDFEEYIKNNPNANIVEMDTVIGKFEEAYIEENDFYVTTYEMDTDSFEIKTLNKQEHDAFCDHIDTQADDLAEQSLVEMSADAQILKKKYPTLVLRKFKKAKI